MDSTSNLEKGDRAELQRQQRASDAHGRSGDVDSVVPITSTRYAINKLKLPVKTAWRPWSINDEVGGYVEEYEGLTLVTVRDAGHLVPSYQPARALTMISSFLQGVLPPPKQYL
ncbi:hypothetical protein Golax_016460 [Gossypium laxum]|uniref:Uncharacterized protein n=1 Tax=Gossypium laxum TaxID=34288 RepID=A0A7J8YX67_9ROSI|nr:hypothetical protein [Gossypium laxum]